MREIKTHHGLLIVDQIPFPLQNTVITARTTRPHPRTPIKVLPPLHLLGVEPRHHLVHDGLHLRIRLEEHLVLLLVDEVARRTRRLAVFEVPQNTPSANYKPGGFETNSLRLYTR